MQVVILAGGLGTRLSEETDRIPKPMVPIGSRPILWHIMKIYAHHGFNDFIICAGYKADVIIEYFINYRFHNSNIKVELDNGVITCLKEPRETWNVHIINTGEKSETGGRLLRIRDHLNDSEPFCMTYGDGVSDVNVKEVVRFHQKNGCKATLTAVRPPSRFGAVEIAKGRVKSFSEKPLSGENLINGGFFILDPSVLDLIENDQTIWERKPLENLTKNGELGAYIHNGFWHPMDTLRDHRYLEQLWLSNQAPWKVWSD